MRLVMLLLVLELVLAGENFESFRRTPASHRIFYILPIPSYFMRAKTAQEIMMMKNGRHNMPLLGLGGRRPTMASTHPTSLVPSRLPTTVPYLPPQDQTNSPSHHGQRLPSSDTGHGQSHSVFNQGHNLSGFHGGFKRPSLSDNAFLDSKPGVSDHEDKRTGFVKGFKTPSFSHSPFSSSQDHKPSSEEGNNHSNSDENRKSSSFDEGKITQLFDKLAPHPDRNPVCNVLPDPGTCRAALPRYYLDPETGTCNCYLYGGCTEDGAGESPGSFFTLEECQNVCHPPNMEEGPVCKGIFKEDDFVSFLVEPLSTKNTKTDHLNDEELLSSFSK